jgi:hypothetical protein
MEVNVIQEQTWILRTTQTMQFTDENSNCLFEWKQYYWGFGHSQASGKACVIHKFRSLVNLREKADLVNMHDISYQLKNGDKQYVTVDLPGAVLQIGGGEFFQCGRERRY